MRGHWLWACIPTKVRDLRGRYKTINMAGILLGQGVEVIGPLIVGGGTPPSLNIGLFVNNHTPSWGDTNSAYTECTISGYSQVNIPSPNWIIFVGGGPPATVTGTPALYTVVGGSGQIVYGYFILDTNSGLYLAAEKFSTAWNPSSGGSFAIVPVWNILDS